MCCVFFIFLTTDNDVGLCAPTRARNTIRLNITDSTYTAPVLIRRRRLNGARCLLPVARFSLTWLHSPNITKRWDDNENRFYFNRVLIGPDWKWFRNLVLFRAIWTSSVFRPLAAGIHFVRAKFEGCQLDAWLTYAVCEMFWKLLVFGRIVSIKNLFEIF